jgi:nitrogen regulatory protein PII
MSSELQFIVAFIQPFQLDAVVDAVRRMPNFPGMSVNEVRGFGSHVCHPPPAGERSEVRAFEARLRLEVFCRLDEMTSIVGTIRQAAHTGHPGDGKVFAGPVTLAQRIRTGEGGNAAILSDEHSAGTNQGARRTSGESARSVPRLQGPRDELRRRGRRPQT